MGSLVTFDCFDTVLTRAVGGPRSVGYFVAARLIRAGVIGVGAEVYVAARRQAEELAYRRLGDRQTLTDISVQLAELLGLDPAVAAELERAELEVEREVSRVVPAAVAQVEAARASGAQVGFLSDTPFPLAAVEDLLRGPGILRDGDLVWVSNDLGASKDGGGAYAEVARRLGGRYSRWSHVGDNPRADVRMARLAGVSPTWEARARLNRFETILDAAAGSTAGFSSLLAGASRRTRLVMEVERPHLPSARVGVAAGVVAPVLVGYVLWCLRRAQRSGCRRVYFVARDGEVMLAIARRLVEGLGLDLDLRYLQGSRRAWLLPSLGEMDAGRLAAVLGREEKVTVRSCLQWVDLTPEAVAPALTATGFPAGSWDERLDRGAVERLVQVLVGPDLDRQVKERVEERTAVTQDYLRQEGLCDGEPYALVDIGWQGTVGRLLTAVLEGCGGRAPAVECYFGLTLPRHEAAGRDLHGYMYDDWRGTGVGRRFIDDWVALEVFTSPMHGKVQGYEYVDGAATPVHSQPGPVATREWGLADVRRAIDVFCDELAPMLGRVDPYADVRAPTWKALRAFWESPTPAEVRAWGDFPMGDEQHYRIAGGFTTAQVLQDAAAGRMRMRPRGTWPAGVRERASKPLRVLDRGVKAARAAVEKGGRVRRVASARVQVRRRIRG